MAIPVQQRFIDYYGQDRYSSAFNRLTRIFTGGNNIVLAFNDINEIDPSKQSCFPLTLVDGTDNNGVHFNRYVRIGAGVAIADDVGIHVKISHDLDLYNIEDYIYYPGDPPGPGYPNDDVGVTYNYYIVLYYKASRGYPPSEAKYYFVKNQKLFIDHMNDFVCLGIAHVEKDPELFEPNGGYKLIDIVLVDYVQGYEIVARRNYPVRYPTEAEYAESIDGGWLDNPADPEDYINATQIDADSEVRGWEDLVS